MRFVTAAIGRVLAIAGLVAGVTAPGLAPAQPAEIRFASVGGITDAPLYLAEELGLFAKAGISVKRQRMNNAPTLLTAIATDQLDVAGISVTPGLFTSVQQGVQIRIVGDKQSLRPGFSATRLVIRSDLAKGSEAETVAALKGKSVAVSAKASQVYMLLVKLLRKHGMAASDVRIVELAYPNMLPALTSKAVDAAISLEPFLSQTVQSGIAQVVSDLAEFVPAEGGTIVPIVYSETFARKAEPARAFMKAYMQGVRIYNDAFVKGSDKDKVVEIVARHARVDPKVVSDGFPAGLDPNQRVSIDFLRDSQAFFAEQNLVRNPIDVTTLVDLSFADAAVKDLGPYR